MVKHPGWNHSIFTVHLQTGHEMVLGSINICFPLLFPYSDRLMRVGSCCQFLSFLFYIKAWEKKVFCSVWADELMGKRAKPDHWNLSVMKFGGSWNNKGQCSHRAGHPPPPTTNFFIQGYNSRYLGSDCELRYACLNLASIFLSAPVLISVLWIVFLWLDSRLLWIRFISLDQAI